MQALVPPFPPDLLQMGLAMPCRPRLARATPPTTGAEPLALHLSGRSRRIVALLCATIALSLCDLVLTVYHLLHIGMFEANPLARWVLHSYSVPLITLYKAALVAIAVGILYKLRWSPLSEAASWLVTIMLVLVMVRWDGYTRAIDEIAPLECETIAGAQFVPPPPIADLEAGVPFSIRLSAR